MNKEYGIQEFIEDLPLILMILCTFEEFQGLYKGLYVILLMYLR